VYSLTQHPAIAYYNLGIPISISSDDPARFGYSGVTPDFFVVTHAFGFDLKDLKLLGIYSIIHALCSNEVKQMMLELFNKQWSEFIASLKTQFKI
jgi:adenosine deaminase CECR1